MKTLVEQLEENKPVKVDENMGSSDRATVVIGEHRVHVGIHCDVEKKSHDSFMKEDDVAVQAALKAAIEDEAKKFMSAVQAKLAAMQNL